MNKPSPARVAARDTIRQILGSARRYRTLPVLRRALVNAWRESGVSHPTWRKAVWDVTGGRLRDIQDPRRAVAA